ncbi:MAG: hypothetical protein O2855_08390, partial [Planctomycetota bacterium]|nr:hypothetical protein [Planctomycetota bacterium]
MSTGAIVTDLGGSCISNNCDDCLVAPPCPADLNTDGAVNGVDLSMTLSGWGTSTGDVNGDGLTDGIDLATLLSNWGPC